MFQGSSLNTSLYWVAKLITLTIYTHPKHPLLRSCYWHFIAAWVSSASLFFNKMIENLLFEPWSLLYIWLEIFVVKWAFMLFVSSLDWRYRHVANWASERIRVHYVKLASRSSYLSWTIFVRVNTWQNLKESI